MGHEWREDGEQMPYALFLVRFFIPNAVAGREAQASTIVKIIVPKWSLGRK